MGTREKEKQKKTDCDAPYAHAYLTNAFKDTCLSVKKKKNPPLKLTIECDSSLFSLLTMMSLMRTALIKTQAKSFVLI